MKLSGTKVVIRNIARSDIPLLVKWKNDAEIADLVRGGPINTTFEIESRRYDRSMEEHDTTRLIVETAGGKPIGFLSLGDIDKENHKAVLGMLIGEKDYWGRGYGTDCLNTLLKHLFLQLEFNRISLEVFEYNHRAKKVYEKIGFKVEGIQRQGLYRDLKYYDVFLMGIIKDDFLKKIEVPN